MYSLMLIPLLYNAIVQAQNADEDLMSFVTVSQCTHALYQIIFMYTILTEDFDAGSSPMLEPCNTMCTTIIATV